MTARSRKWGDSIDRRCVAGDRCGVEPQLHPTLCIPNKQIKERKMCARAGPMPGMLT